MPTIRQLEAQLKRSAREHGDLRRMLKELRDKKELPGLKRKYEGKYFKYRNYHSESEWDIYLYCHVVNTTDEAIVEMFECDPHGTWLFATERKTDLSLLQTEITETEYDDAARAFMSAASCIKQLEEPLKK